MYGYYNFITRFFDILIATLLVTILLPVFLVIAVLLFIFNDRNILFKHVRPGKGEHVFVLYKFKTMKDKYNSDAKLLPDCERLTKIGLFLRNWSLDEIPQLLNVIKGDMSLVGPRPLFQEYLPLYSSKHAMRHLILPGITGWAQINGRNSISWEKKLDMDVWYVGNRSLKLYVYIIYKTIGYIIMRKDVIYPGTVSMPRLKENYDK